jgi:hypothetical protein
VPISARPDDAGAGPDCRALPRSGRTDCERRPGRVSYVDGARSHQASAVAERPPESTEPAERAFEVDVGFEHRNAQDPNPIEDCDTSRSSSPAVSIRSSRSNPWTDPKSVARPFLGEGGVTAPERPNASVGWMERCDSTTRNPPARQAALPASEGCATRGLAAPPALEEPGDTKTSLYALAGQRRRFRVSVRLGACPRINSSHARTYVEPGATVSPFFPESAFHQPTLMPQVIERVKVNSRTGS